MKPMTWCKVMGNLPEGLVSLLIDNFDNNQNLEVPDLKIKPPRSLRHLALLFITMSLDAWSFLDATPSTLKITLNGCRVYSDKRSESWLKTLKKKMILLDVNRCILQDGR